MKILVYGLPTSGKTTLGKKITDALSNSVVRHYDADTVREDWDDWAFDQNGRHRQAIRMRALAKLNSKYGIATIIDFVCPFNRFRNDEMWDVTIFMDTVSSSPYPDTDKIFERPNKEPTYTIDSWDEVDGIVDEIVEQIQSFKYEEE